MLLNLKKWLCITLFMPVVFGYLFCYDNVANAHSPSSKTTKKTADAPPDITITTPSTTTLFDVAVVEFRKGNYESALNGFLEAQAAGFDSPSLLYNIAVCNYRLGRLDEAKKVFNKTANSESPFASLAYYNLGIIALSQDDEEAAEKLFEVVLKSDSNAKLKQLATEGLERTLLEYETRNKNRLFQPSWQSLIIFGGGYDDNVTLTSSTEVITASELDDSFTELFLTAELKLLHLGYGDLSLKASGYTQVYSKLDSFNQAQILLGVDLIGRAIKNKPRIGLHMSRSYVNDNAFLKKASLTTQYRRAAGQSTDLDIRYFLSRYDEEDATYAYLSGLQQLLDISSTSYLGNNRLQVGYVYEWNDRKDRLTPEFTSFSPTRHKVYIAGRLDMSPDLKLGLNVEFRFSEYNDPNNLPNELLRTRLDERYSIGLRATRNLYGKVDLNVEYQYRANDSNLSEFIYTENQFSFYLFASF